MKLVILAVVFLNCSLGMFWDSRAVVSRQWVGLEIFVWAHQRPIFGRLGYFFGGWFGVAYLEIDRNPVLSG